MNLTMWDFNVKLNASPEIILSLIAIVFLVLIYLFR